MLKSKQNMEANCKHGSYSTQQRQYNKKKKPIQKSFQVQKFVISLL